MDKKTSCQFQNSPFTCQDKTESNNCGCACHGLFTTWFSALVLGIFLLVSTLSGAAVYLKGKRADDAITVTGSSKRAVISDRVKWTTQFTRQTAGGNLKAATDQLKNDLKIVTKFYADNGFPEKDLIISPVYNEQVYKQNYDGVQDYILRQTIQIQSNDITKVSKLSKDLTSVQDQGVIFTTQNVEYYYSKLADLRIEMLSEAIKDARSRAEQIAQSGQTKLGSLTTASSGVVQVLQPNSTDISDYGSYDTSTIDKEVTSTVRVTFSLK